VAKVYIVSFRTHDDRPSKFIVLADNMKSAINKAWEHGGAHFQSRFDKSTAQAQEMKEGGYEFCDCHCSASQLRLLARGSPQKTRSGPQIDPFLLEPDDQTVIDWELSSATIPSSGRVVAFLHHLKNSLFLRRILQWMNTTAAKTHRIVA
jgi:hypothetical protein